MRSAGQTRCCTRSCKRFQARSTVYLGSRLHNIDSFPRTRPFFIDTASRMPATHILPAAERCPHARSRLSPMAAFLPSASMRRVLLMRDLFLAGGGVRSDKGVAYMALCVLRIGFDNLFSAVEAARGQLKATISRSEESGSYFCSACNNTG